MLRANTSEKTSTARPTSHATMAYLRLTRSAMTPPTGAKKSPGRMRDTRASTMPLPPARLSARERVARMATQSPALLIRPALHRRAKGPERIRVQVLRGGASITARAYQRGCAAPPIGAHSAAGPRFAGGQGLTSLPSATRRSRRAASRALARSSVMRSTESSRRSEAFTEPSVT